MWPNRFLRSTPFRLAIGFAVLFVLSFTVAGTAALLSIAGDLNERLDRDVLGTFEGLKGLAVTADELDQEDLASAVDRMAAASSKRDRIFLLRGADGIALAGNVRAVPSTPGWSTSSAAELGMGAGRDIRFRLYSGTVADKLLLTVGASVEASSEIVETALEGFLWATAAVLAFAIVGGLLLATREQRRIGRIADALNAVGEGNLDTRIAVGSSGDDLDQLSRQINGALDRLKRLVEGMRQVSADIAHDLKTPLGRLHITLQSALQRAEAGEIDRHGLEMALQESQQINEVFDGLLRITQIGAGARRGRFTDVDLGELVDTIFDVYEPVAFEEGKVLVRLPPRLAVVARPGERGLLLQMLANLVENAIRHTPPRSVIELGCKAVTSGGAIEITVADNGSGIPEQDREKVFERLYRLEKSRTTPGSGLGLSLVKAIAELHGATVSLADNQPGVRAVVRFDAQPANLTKS